jgi:hypothetical protein
MTRDRQTSYDVQSRQSNGYKTLPATQKNAGLISKADMPYIAAILLGGIYLGTTQPLMMAVFAVTGAVALLCAQVYKAAPFLHRQFNLRLRFSHVAAVMMVVVLLFGGLMDSPAHALFLEGFEKGITKLISESGSTIAAGTITSVFTLIRILFLFVVVAAGIYAYNQAQQGNDWRPIITQVSIAIAVIIALDVLTKLFLG